MALKIQKLVSSLLLSEGLKKFRFGRKALVRKLSGQRPEVLYFHQPDDPYSHFGVSRSKVKATVNPKTLSGQ